MLKINSQIGTTYVSYSPDFYKRCLSNYKQGYFRDIMALYEQVEADSYCGGCIEGRQDGFKRDWRVTEISQNSDDVRYKEFIESIFLNLPMNDLFDYIHDARLKGFNVIELNWEVVNNKLIINSVNKIDQKYFRLDPVDKKTLKIDFGNRLNIIPPDSALVCRSLKLPLLIPVARDFILKEFGIESWSGFIETFGEPFIIGRYPPGASDDFKKELENAVRTLGSSARGILPIGAEIEVIEAKRNSGDHNSYVQKAETGIAITILGHENAVKSASGLQIGENQAPYKAARSKVLSDIRFIEAHIFELIKIILRLNFPGVSKFPVFSIDNSEPINVSERLQVIDSAYDKGYQISADEYAKLGLIKSDKQEPFLIRDFNNPADISI